MDGADHGIFRLVVGLNGAPEIDNGLHAMASNPIAGFVDFSVSGALQMEAGDWVSVWVFADEDDSYSVHRSSGFSCALVETAEGFGADLSAEHLAPSTNSSDWAEVVGWEAAGSGGQGGLFALGAGFEAAAGRYTVEVSGLYFIAATIRLDDAVPGGEYRVAVSVNGSVSAGESVQAVRTGEALGVYGSMSVSGVLALGSGDSLSVWVQGRTSAELNFTVSSQSGFSAVCLENHAEPDAGSGSWISDDGSNSKLVAINATATAGQQVTALWVDALAAAGMPTMPWSVNGSGVLNVSAGQFVVLKAGTFLISAHLELATHVNTTRCGEERAVIAGVRSHYLLTRRPAPPHHSLPCHSDIRTWYAPQLQSWSTAAPSF